MSTGEHGGADAIIDPELLLLAYRSGIFPMADARDDPDVMWIEPRERAIIPLDGLRVSRSLAKAIRRDALRVTCNRDFPAVVAACAAPRKTEGGESWISHRIAASYGVLNRQGHAHSIEVWDGDALVGGLYGVAFERVFCGESMFSRARDASKIALAWLVAAMRVADYRLLDCQFMTPHLATLGAVAMPQSEYLSLLRRAVQEGDPPMPLPAAYELLAGSSSPGKDIAQSLTQRS